MGLSPSCGGIELLKKSRRSWPWGFLSSGVHAIVRRRGALRGARMTVHSGITQL